jgi:hypothetical protein
MGLHFVMISVTIFLSSDHDTKQGVAIMTAAVELDRIYAVYYRLRPRCSEAGIGRVVADSLEEAKRLARDAVAKAHPEGRVMAVVLAKNSPYPVKDASGALVAPSLVN